jgi:hypothetical protein
MQRGRRNFFEPGTIYGRAFRQRLTRATFPDRNCIRLKNDIVSKQFPCMREKHRHVSTSGKTMERVSQNLEENASGRAGMQNSHTMKGGLDLRHENQRYDTALIEKIIISSQHYDT